MSDIYYLYTAYGVMISLYAMWARQMYLRITSLAKRIESSEKNLFPKD